MEDYLRLKYEAKRKMLNEEHEAALRPHKAAYEAEDALINKVVYIRGDSDGGALLKRIKHMQKPRQDNYERYRKATQELVVEYDRKLNEAHREYQRQIAEFRAKVAELSQ